MSHYARLKVTPDAPVEVIRAAYRVLAAKYHPDRQASAGEGSDDAAHAANAEMAALNTAYQVLVHPDRRREYDGLLAEKKALHKSRAAAKAKQAAVVEPEPVNARVDMEWLPPKSPEEEQPWHRSRRAMFLGGSLVGVVLVGGAFWISHLVVQHQMEKALSEQYAASPAHVLPADPVQSPLPLRLLPGVDGVPLRHAPSSAVSDADAALSVASGPEPVRHVPSVTDLSKLTHEELAQLLPELEGAPVPRRRPQHHPLDGQPLNLRQDGQLIEVLPNSVR